MFIKRTRGGSKEKPIYYLQLVQSYRDESGKPKHRVICTLGREEDLINSGTIDSLAQKFADLSDKFILLDNLISRKIITMFLDQSPDSP